MPTPYTPYVEGYGAYAARPPPPPPGGHPPSHYPFVGFTPYGVPAPPPPRVARKAGKNIIWWPTDEGSLASRSIGKVNIDCRLRLSESKWGVIDGSQPAGILYVDLTFDQPSHCRLSSATVLISLEECDESKSDKRKAKEKDKNNNEIKLSTLRICEFGPKLLRGEPTTLKRKTEYHFTPEVNAGIGGFGGLGVRRHNSIHYVSRWILKGNTLAPAEKKHKTAGIVYRTLKWELTENELAFQPTEKSVVHTAFAFAHELKRFYIKVEISGKLSNTVNRLRHGIFPPTLKRNQGTLFTLVDLGAKDGNRQESLDSCAKELEEKMAERNLVVLDPKNTEESGGLEDDEFEDTAETVDLADLARATEKYAPTVSSPPKDPGVPGAVPPPNMSTTPKSSFSSTTSTLVPPSSEDPSDPPTSVSAPGTTGAKSGPKKKPKDSGEDKTPKTATSATKSAKTPAGATYKKPTVQDVDDRKPVERAVKNVAEVQFMEVLVVLRAWAYATFLAMFMRNQNRKTLKTILIGEDSREREGCDEVS